MTYQYATNESAALALLAEAKAAGLRGYVICLNAVNYEVRCWK